MDHLEPSQFLDLDQPRRLGPLFDTATTHLAECPQCRQAWLEYQAIKALALEASIEPEGRLRRKALQAARRIEVEERLGAEAGPDAAREILLQRRAGQDQPRTAPLAAALILLLALAGIYFYSQKRQHPAELAPAPLPFEFQPTPMAAPAELSATAEATPAMAPGEKAEDEELDNEARRLLLAHLKKEGRSEASPTPLPGAEKQLPSIPAPTRAVPKIEPTRRPTPRPATPTPAPTLQPTAPPSPAPTEDASVDFRGSSPPADASPAPEQPAASLQVEGAKFSVSKGESAALMLFLPESGAVEIRVFDASGKSVKLLTDAVAGAGHSEFRFKGSGDDGQPLPAGTYYARVMTRWFSRVEALELAP